MKIIIAILESYNDDEEKKDLIMSQLASCQIDSDSGLEIIENLY